MYRVDNINSLGQVVNRGGMGFRDFNMAANYAWCVIRECRKNRACQIRTVTITAGDEIIVKRTV